MKVGYYYGSLVNVDVWHVQHTFLTYGEWILDVI